MTDYFINPSNKISDHKPAEKSLKAYLWENRYTRTEHQEVTFSDWYYWDYTDSPFWSVRASICNAGVVAFIRGFHIHDNGTILEIEI